MHNGHVMIPIVMAAVPPVTTNEDKNSKKIQPTDEKVSQVLA